MNKLCLLLLGLSLPAVAADWPQFLGPTADGVSTETGLIDAFPKGGPKPLFAKRIGTGYAAPSIRDGKAVVFHRASKLYKVEEGDNFETVVKYVNAELAALKANERLTVEGLQKSLKDTTRRVPRGYIPLPEAVAKHLDV